MRKINREIWINSLISCLIGLAVGMVEVIFPIFNGDIAAILIRDAIIGILIGTLARFGCHFMLKEKATSMNILYIYVFFTILIVSSIPAIMMQWLLGKPFIAKQFILMISVAEILGLSFTYASIKHYFRLNNQLIMKKRELLRKE